MKIILISSSLKPGHDGVGDFARQIASELILQGHNAYLLALHDKFINSPFVGTQITNSLEIPVCRIPAETDASQKISLAKSWIDDIDPDWLSFQYVPFGYHPKGLPFGLSRLLAAIGNGRRWQIMFHELWVGMAREESVKLKLWGKLQRYIVRSLIRDLAPQVIHTQTRLYVEQLTKMGYKASYLPICSNIPVSPGFIKADTLAIRLIVFGSIHSGAAIDSLAADAALYAQKYRTPVSLVFAGHCGAEQDKWAAVWQQAGLDIEINGPQPEDGISALLHGATLGVASTAMAVIEKSGAFAAMRAHGLPVINISKTWTPRGVSRQSTTPGIAPYAPGKFEELLNNRNKYTVAATPASAIARTMVEDLQKEYSI